MKQLFTRLTLFFALSLSVYGGYLALLAHIFRTPYLYRIPAGKTTLIIGNSHTGCDINDTLMDNAYNLSQPADAIANTYEKLQIFLPLNPGIKTVVMGLNEGDISLHTEQKEDLTKAMKTHIANYYHLMTPAELLYLVAKNPREALVGLTAIPRSRTGLAYKILKKKVTLTDMDFGHYYWIAGQINYDKELKKFAADPGDKTKVSERQVAYLDKIVALCGRQHVRLIFIRTPEHKIYKRENEQIFLKLIHEQYGAIPFRDWVDVPFADSCFEDHDHLNYLGAMLLTDSLRAYLRAAE